MAPAVHPTHSTTPWYNEPNRYWLWFSSRFVSSSFPYGYLLALFSDLPNQQSGLRGENVSEKFVRCLVTNSWIQNQTQNLLHIWIWSSNMMPPVSLSFLYNFGRYAGSVDGFSESLYSYHTQKRVVMWSDATPMEIFSLPFLSNFPIVITNSRSGTPDRPTIKIWKGKQYRVLSGPVVGLPFQVDETGYRVFSIVPRAPLQIPRK
jgi:hypothetical protein